LTAGLLLIFKEQDSSQEKKIIITYNNSHVRYNYITYIFKRISFSLTS